MSIKSRADAILNQCYDDYRIKLFNYCLSRLDGSREAADDCVQETFILFYSKLIEGEEFQNPRAFLYRSADNFVKRQRHKASVDAMRHIPLDEARDASSDDIELNELYVNIDYEKCAQMLIETLSEEEQKLYTMRYQQKMSVEEISDAFGISRPATSMRLIRMRNRIKEMITDSFFEEKGG